MKKRFGVAIFLAALLFFNVRVQGWNHTASRLEARRDQNEGVELALRTELMTDYRRDIASYGPNNDDILSVSLQLTKIIDLDEKAEQLAVAFYVDITWVDRRLGWELDQFNQRHPLEMDLKNIWSPNVVHSNSIHSKNELMTQDQRVATLSGFVTWSGTLVLTSPCEMEVTYFPVDRQDCELQFRLAPRKTQPRLSGRVIDPIVAMSMDTKYYKDSSWHVSEYTDISIINPTDDAPYTMRVHIKLQRKYQYYINRILTPVTLLAVLVVVGFFIPPDAGEKIGFGVTLLLTFSVFQTMIDEDLPASSDSTPILTTGMILLQVCSTASIVAAVIVLNLHHLGSEYGGRMPRWLRFLFLTILAKPTFHTGAVKMIRKDETKTCGRRRIEPKLDKESADEDERPKTMEPNDDEWVELARNEWKVAALILDRLLMYICLSAVSVIYTKLLQQLMDQPTAAAT